MSEPSFSNFEAWEAQVPETIAGDALWRMEVYRLALFALDVGGHDVTQLRGDRRTLRLSDQLYRALGSASANIAEGYSRRSGRDRARFYEYALGSARESRTWYHGGHHVLRPAVTRHRMHLLTQIPRLLLAIIPRQRKKSRIREPETPYQPQAPAEEASEEKIQLETLLEDIPFAKSPSP